MTQLFLKEVQINGKMRYLRQRSRLQQSGFPFPPPFRQNLEGEREACEGDRERFSQEDLRLHPLPAVR
jgi:hypothetical protein